MASKLVTEHYGAFKDKETDQWWLLQQSGCLSPIGLATKFCPFRIKTPLMLCPHDVDFTGAETANFQMFMRHLEACPILKLFDPVDILLNKRTAYIRTSDATDFNALTKAQNLGSISRINSSAVATIKNDISPVLRRLKNSNLTTYVVYGVKATDLKLVDDLVMAASQLPGRLILVGDFVSLRNPKMVETYQPSGIEIKFLNSVTINELRQIGSYRLKTFMRS